MPQIYGFKPNAKQMVINKALRLYGRDAKVKVTGERLQPVDCKQRGIPLGSYLVTCLVNGKEIAEANLRDWRKAYALLVVEVEKAYTVSLTNITTA